LKPFCKLSDPSRYVACSWNLNTDDAGRAHWVGFHLRHVNTLLDLGTKAAIARGESPDGVAIRAISCHEEFNATFTAYAENPGGFGQVTILTLDLWRDRILRRHGFFDPMIDLKDRENEKMLPLLPELCQRLDRQSSQFQLLGLILGVFAGNIFDMGSEATSKLFLGNSPDFYTVRNNLAPRPWLIDDYDALSRRLLNAWRHRKALFFVDNAGSDFILGAIPLIRWLAIRETRVCICANNLPTLNDMAIDDVRRWWPKIVAVEPSLAKLPIDLINTGTAEPLIDLSSVSDELNAAAADADLIILEGMGRGVESNLDADFTCDVANLAMIKDISIAQRHGGKLYDIICRVRPAKG
jgi:type II pantothenate kinase